MALIFRGQLNRPLTSAEIDSNFAYFTGSHSITGSLTISGSLIPTVGAGELTSSFSLGSETAAWKDIYVSNGSIKFVSGAPGNIQTSSLSVGASGGIQVSSDFLPPVGNYNLTLGSPDQFWKSLYVGTGSVNFTTQVNNTGLVIASIKAVGEYGTPGSILNGGMVFIEVTPTKRGSFRVGSTQTEARGTGSFAQGDGTLASGNYSHAQGEKSIASGIGSHAEGNGTIASGLYSHAEGSSTSAVGLSSHAEGLGTIASGSYQTVVGQFNVASTSASAFIIGDGVGLSRRNLLFTSRSWFEVSASNAFFKGLPVSSSGYVVNINPSTGKLSYSTGSGGGAGIPGGLNTNIQYNNNGGFGGDSNFNYNSTLNDVSVTGSVTVDGTFNTPQVINYNIDVPTNTNAALMGPTVAFVNEVSVQANSFLTILGDIAMPQALQPQTLQVDQGTILNGSVTLNLAEIPNATNDIAASNAGVEVGGLYRNGNILQIRLT